MSALPKHAIDDKALLDPLHYAMASRDADVLTLVREALAAKRAQLAFQPIVTAGPQGRAEIHPWLDHCAVAETALRKSVVHITISLSGRTGPVRHVMALRRSGLSFDEFSKGPSL